MNNLKYSFDIYLGHLRDIAAGLKRHIKCEAVRVIHIPQYEGLKVETMLDFAQLHPQVLEHLPVAKEIKKLSRAYLGNVIYTIVGNPFKEWVDGKIKERHAKIKEQ